MDQTSHHRLTLANRITIVRILSVPLFVLLLVYYTLGLKSGAPSEMQRVAALVLFVAAAATDALDGYFARSRNEITNLGRILDPIADKSLLLAGLILLTRPSIPALSPHIPIWFTLLVVSRDVVLILGSMLIHHIVGVVEIRPHFVGKVATVLQMLTVLWVLIGASRPFLPTVVAAGVLTFYAGAIYVLNGIRQLERAAAGHKQPHTVPHV
jgi:cardiolipin synthase (CMP-forming)